MIRFKEQGKKSYLTHKIELKKFIAQKIKETTSSIEKVDLTYIFVDDESLYKMNVQYLDHDTYTDIITFDLGEYEDELIGEMYISIDRVRDNAEELKVTYLEELHRVIFHGLLHLLGYDDKDEKSKKTMRKMEDKYIKEYFS